MLNRLRFFLIRLIVGKTPVIANMHFRGQIHIGEVAGGSFWSNRFTDVA